MTQRPCPRTTSKKTAVLTLTAILLGLPTLTLAAPTICEQGVITRLQLASGGDSRVFFSTDYNPSNWVERGSLDGLDGTEMFYDNGTRWRDRIALLRLAFAMGWRVRVVSDDYNCIGSSDEFTITVWRN